MKVEFSAVNSHAHRQCHPETCCCSTDWLVVRFEYDRCGHITRREIQDSYKKGIGATKSRCIKSQTKKPNAMIIVKNFPSVGSDSTIDNVAEITGLTHNEIKQRYETFETPELPIKVEVTTKGLFFSATKEYSISDFKISNSQWHNMSYFEKEAAIQAFFSSDEQVTNINEIDL